MAPGHGAGVPGALVAARRRKPPLPPLRQTVAPPRRGRDGLADPAGHLVQQHPAAAGGGCAPRPAPAPAGLRLHPAAGARAGLAQRGARAAAAARGTMAGARRDAPRRPVAAGGTREPQAVRVSPGLAAIFGISSSLGYLLPAIIGLESVGVPSPGEPALVLAAILPSQGNLQIWLVLVIGSAAAIVGANIGYLPGR